MPFSLAEAVRAWQSTKPVSTTSDKAKAGAMEMAMMLAIAIATAMAKQEPTKVRYSCLRTVSALPLQWPKPPSTAAIFSVVYRSSFFKGFAQHVFSSTN
jgi:hypothetical protein